MMGPMSPAFMSAMGSMLDAYTYATLDRSAGPASQESHNSGNFFGRL